VFVQNSRPLDLPTKGVRITSAFQAPRASACSAAWSQGLLTGCCRRQVAVR